ncbi:MAG: DUF5686 and carboxypeptidase regulatory-like domain-containing protein [Bacteroidales bacterium]|nr:DUF5686 and carboxypeptidase regulatory-like domain-containing protein [Bacteroidales bacterium]MCL2133293.1 DUF5686 and carboxypeptidase regulatory-like domain-containing protein [Bacteroidales bacterium]
MQRFFFYLLLLILFTPFSAFSQALKGRVQDEKKIGISYASVYIKEVKQGIAANEDGEFELKLPSGKYTIVAQSLGYDVQTIEVQLPQNTPLIITLSEKTYELRSVYLSATGEDPAYIIMRKAIGMAPYYRNVVNNYSADVYLKTKIKVEEIKGMAALMMKKKDRSLLAGTTILQESINEIIYTAPDQYKQTVKSTLNATSADLASLGFNESDFNSGMARFNIYGTDPSLPLAPVAFSNYKFVYEGDREIDGKLVNKIKVIPRRKSNDLMAGYLYIVDQTWNVYSADLLQETTFGSLRIQQNYDEVENGILLPSSYNIDVKIDVLGVKGNGNLIGSVKYQTINTNKHLLRQQANVTKTEVPTTKSTTSKKETLQEEAVKIASKDRVNNADMRKLEKLEKQIAEISEKERLAAEGKTKSLEVPARRYTITKDSSMTRNDTTYFQLMRPVPLVKEELITYHKYDSVVRINPRDSTGKALNYNNNKQGWASIVFLGTTSKSFKNGFDLQFSGLLAPLNLDFNTVDGFVYGLSGTLRKDYKQGQRWWLSGSFDWAFSRQVPLWEASFQHLYLPNRRAYWKIEGGQQSKDFAGENGVGKMNMWSSLWYRVNYAMFYHDNYLRLSHRIDIANGLELYTALQWSDRQELSNNSDFSFFYSNSRDYRLNIPRNADVTLNPELTADNRATLLNAQLNYTPEYYYRKRGERKIMMYSHYPTFSLLWLKGIPNMFESVSDFDFLRFKVSQTISYGYFSEFSYTASAGKFFNAKRLSFADFRHFYANEALASLDHTGAEPYQLLPQYTFSANDWYLSANAHYRSPLLALKYLPFLSNALFDENLYFSYLLHPEMRHYVEVGYGISLLKLMDIGAYVGFNDKGYRSWGFRFSMDLKSITEVVL